MIRICLYLCTHIKNICTYTFVRVCMYVQMSSVIDETFYITMNHRHYFYVIVSAYRYEYNCLNFILKKQIPSAFVYWESGELVFRFIFLTWNQIWQISEQSNTVTITLQFTTLAYLNHNQLQVVLNTYLQVWSNTVYHRAWMNKLPASE